MAIDAEADDGVDHRGAERGDVHDPADRRAAEEGDRQRHQDDEQDRLNRNAVAAEPLEAGGGVAFPAHGIDQAAEREQIADEAREDDAKKRKQKDRDAKASHVVVGRVERRHGLDPGEVAHVSDVVDPALVFGRIGRHGKQRDEDVEGRCEDDRPDQDRAHLLHREVVLLGKVRNVFKADESPGRDCGDVHDLREGHCALKVQGRIAEGSSVQEDGRQGADREARRKDERRGDHDPVDVPRAPGAKQPDQGDGRHGKQPLAEPHLIAENGVVVSELERIAKEEPGEKRNRGDVGPEDRKVGEQDEPAREESEIASAGLARKRIDAAGALAVADHVLQIPGHHQNDGQADQHSEERPQDARSLQVRIAGDDERPPADAGADGKRPHAERREAALQFRCWLGLHVYLSLRLARCPPPPGGTDKSIATDGGGTSIWHVAHITQLHPYSQCVSYSTNKVISTLQNQVMSHNGSACAQKGRKHAACGHLFAARDPEVGSHAANAPLYQSA